MLKEFKASFKEVVISYGLKGLKYNLKNGKVLYKICALKNEVLAKDKELLNNLFFLICFTENIQKVRKEKMLKGLNIFVQIVADKEIDRRQILVLKYCHFCKHLNVLNQHFYKGLYWVFDFWDNQLIMSITYNITLKLYLIRIHSLPKLLSLILFNHFALLSFSFERIKHILKFLFRYFVVLIFFFKIHCFEHLFY